MTGAVLVWLVALLLTPRNDRDAMNQAVGEILPAPTEPSKPRSVPGDESRARRKARESVSADSARIRSFLEVRSGEIGMIRIDGGSLGLPEVPVESSSESSRDFPGLSVLLNRETAAAILQGAEREGKRISAILGAGDQGVEWQGERLDLKVTILGIADGMADLQLELREKGERMSKSESAITVAVGHMVAVRSSYPDPEEVLIVVGGDPPEDSRMEIPGTPSE